MIFINDDYFNPEVFSALQDYIKNDFKIEKAGDKEFCILPTPKEILPIIQLDGYELILSFIRKAYKGFDNDMRIHADHIINGKKADIATVIYLNDPEGVTKNGTMFWKHDHYGFRMPEDVSDEEFDRMLQEDSNDMSRWSRSHFISSDPNRMLMYDSNLFHSKFPSSITKGERIVMASFFSKIR